MIVIGLALAPGRLAAVTSKGDRREVPFDGDVAAAFTALKTALGATHARVTVALLSPLVEVRRLVLPRMREAEVRRVLTRDAARYFLTGRDASVVGAMPLAREGSPVPVLAACTRPSLLEEIERAVGAAGWVLEAVVPAHAAWLAGAPQVGALVVAHGDALEVLMLRDGSIAGLRRFRAGSADWPHVAEGLAVASGPIIVLGDAELVTGLSELLPERKVRALSSDPLAFTAAHAVRAGGPELLLERQVADRHGRARRLAAALGAAAAVFVIVAAGLELWGTGRELWAVARQRAALSARVDSAMARREAMGNLRETLHTLGQLEAGAPRWSSVLADLADYVPRDAYVVAFRGAGDSLTLEGVARQAASVFQAVQLVPGIASVRAQAPIRQDVSPDGTVQERFVLGAEVRAQ